MELFHMTTLDLILQQQPLKSWKLQFKLLSHPAYSTDLTPSDYHYFQTKYALHGCWFSNDEVVKDAYHTRLCVQPKTFFTAGIRSSWTEVTNMWRN